VAVGTTKKSIATRSRRWFSRNARHVGEGGVLLRGMYLATVETATSMPSMASSLRIRGAPQVTFACAILRISFTTSRSSPARPKRPNQLLRLQKRLNARRCQRTTVAGSTIARASLHRGHCFDRIAQKARSHPPSRSRRPRRVRSRTATCWRSARFSRASSRCETAISPSRGRPKAGSARGRPYLPNLLPLKAFLPDAILGKHKGFTAVETTGPP
jgi:hypothetical protein